MGKWGKGGERFFFGLFKLVFLIAFVIFSNFVWKVFVLSYGITFFRLSGLLNYLIFGQVSFQDRIIIVMLCNKFHFKIRSKNPHMEFVPVETKTKSLFRIAFSKDFDTLLDDIPRRC